MRSTGPDSSQKSRPVDISCFTDEGDNKEDSQVMTEQLQDKPKDQDGKLIEINLASPCKEARLVFAIANVSQQVKNHYSVYYEIQGCLCIDLRTNARFRPTIDFAYVRY